MIQVYGGPEKAFTALLNGGTSGLDLQVIGDLVEKYGINQMVGKYAKFWTGSEGDDPNAAAYMGLDFEARKASVDYIRKDTWYFNVRLIKK